MKLYAKRIKNFKRSFTREILELTSKEEVISFVGGLPDSSLFPRKDIEYEIGEILKKYDNMLFQYSDSKGTKELREQICKRYGGLEEEILLTSGSQQALDIVCKAFIDVKDKIVVESPTYLAAINLFEMYGADIVDVELSSKGLDMKKLETVFREKRPKLLYTIPTFQNPTGYSWSEDTRLKVVNLAKKYAVMIVEDNPYGELRYDGKEVGGFDRLMPKQTIKISTFSKVLSPDFRIGWIEADKKYIDIFQTIKEYSDLQSSKFFQLVTANMIKNNRLSKHIELLRKEYKIKRDILADTLHGTFGDKIEFQTPKGGMFFWIRFKEDIDTMALFEYATREKVAFVPGEVFFLKDKRSSYIRVNFTNLDAGEIEEGIKRLKRAYEALICK